MHHRIGNRLGAYLRRALVALLMLCPCVARADTLHPGDLVLVTGTMDNNSVSHGVYRLDPATLAPTLISGDGLVHLPNRATIDHRGMILIADATSGIVQVDPTTGSQSALISVAQLGGGVPFGICAAPDNAIYITMQDGPARVLRFVPSTGALTTVSSGGLLTNPGGLTLGSDDMLYLCEMSSPVEFANHQGSIVRVDPSSGNQTLVVASSAFYAPFDIAFVTGDMIWTANRGYVSHRKGYVVSTRLSDGYSQTVDPPDAWSEGVAADGRGNNYLSSCRTVSFDCNSPYTLNPATGAIVGLGGSLAMVPDIVTTVHQGTWGRLKTIYR